MNGHRSNYYRKLPDKPVAEHFNLIGHTFEDMLVIVIEQIIMAGSARRNNGRAFGYTHFRPWHQTASI